MHEVMPEPCQALIHIKNYRLCSQGDIIPILCDYKFKLYISRNLWRWCIALLTIKGIGSHKHPYPPSNKITTIMKEVIKSVAASMDNPTPRRLKDGKFSLISLFFPCLSVSLAIGEPLPKVYDDQLRYLIRMSSKTQYPHGKGVEGRLFVAS
jgi:hypothetical protein